MTERCVIEQINEGPMRSRLMELGLVPGRKMRLKKVFSMVLLFIKSYGVFSMRRDVFDKYIQTKGLRRRK